MRWTTITAVKRSAAGVLVLLLLLRMSPAENDHDIARRLRKTGEIVPIEYILSKLDGTLGVRVLEITLEKRDDHLVYMVEFINPDGIVIKREYDAESGILLKTRQDK